MTPEPTPLVTVTQADREAMASRYEQLGYLAMAAEARAGKYDDRATMQMLARHAANARLAALEEGREQAAGLAEMGDWDSWEALATAIRALSNKGGRDGG